ncbi:MAG: CinA family nicotinamide mononucleotide deamidase-related protein [Bacteriovoracia bacterium]
MRIGMLVIGSELLQGKISDANTPWFAQFLRSWNLTLDQALISHDTPAALAAALGQLSRDCDLIICSGGLGPTADDITKLVIGDFYGRPLTTTPGMRAVARGNYQRQGRELAPEHPYNFAPEGFQLLDNPSGFAPGLFYSHQGRTLLAFPGVPKEFRDMLSAHFPRLVAPLLPQQGLLSLRTFRTRGVPEEKIFFELCPGLWEKLEAFGAVSSLPQIMGVDVGVSVRASDQIELDEKILAVREAIQTSPLAPYVWHEGAESLEELIVARAQSKQMTVSFAESCTGGLCSHRLTNISGSSQVFWGSVVSYDNSVKQNILDVREESLKRFGAVSEEVAKEMALGVRTKLGTDVGISLTGIAGPGGGSELKPVGTVWIGIATKETLVAKKFNFRGDRETLKLRFSQMALYELLDVVTCKDLEK